MRRFRGVLFTVGILAVAVVIGVLGAAYLNQRAEIEALREQVTGLGGRPVDPPKAGERGEQGPAGERGEPGQSIIGPRGEPGQSIAGPQGPAGPAGASIVGPQGPAGRDGRDGADSTVPGPQGDPGEPGADSTVPGPQGPPGETGGHPETFVFTDSLGREFTCTDPDGDGRYECAQTGGPPEEPPPS